MIYEEEGTAAQMDEWIRLADRQLAALLEEHAQLEATIKDLQKLRDDIAKTKN
jgi:hypothetical protein